MFNLLKLVEIRPVKAYVATLDDGTHGTLRTRKPIDKLFGKRVKVTLIGPRGFIYTHKGILRDVWRYSTFGLDRRY